ncbi:hypothetical protein HSBGL_0874 [Halapricum desulfuricans]|uniref:Uncharacterized protein n=1 Tax=Halapricum desulfuricans TaxID=2841257 RepID=A0A897NFU6_9EURY|nr:hypothetical protein HSBGL_0874 [Halapricum desulfuricans]
MCPRERKSKTADNQIDIGNEYPLKLSNIGDERKSNGSERKYCHLAVYSQTDIERLLLQIR